MTPFDALGLPASSQLTNDDVRSAWRRVAAASHPDRADGGDPAAFALAAAAYSALRTAAGRGEALADIRDRDGCCAADYPVPARKGLLSGRAYVAVLRMRHGRPSRLALRLLAVAAAGALAITGAGWQPASMAVLTGALTWLFCTSRRDLAGDRRNWGQRRGCQGGADRNRDGARRGPGVRHLIGR